MISVMNDFEIDRSPNSDPDLSFLGMESPINEEDEGSDSMEADEASPPLDLTIEPEEIEEEQQPRVSSPAPLLPLLPPASPPTAAEASGLVTGDMVWGKVKSHPWWPGHIFNESFALLSVRRTKRDDFVLVAFFGDSSYGWFDHSELIPFEPNFAEKSKQTTSRSFVRAVEESIDEASRRAALGLSCRCRNPYNFRPTRVPDYFEVDVVGYERNGIYSKRQIDRERCSFEPSDALGFLRQLAVTPKEKKTEDVEWYRSLAIVLALRRRIFEEFDPTYAQAFGQQPVAPVRDEKGVPQQAESFAPRVAPLSGPLVFAETLGVKKKPFGKHSASASKSSSSHCRGRPSSLKEKKKNSKYVLKRRDHRPPASSSSPSLPDPYFFRGQQQLPATPPAGSLDSDYVLPKREPAEDDRPSTVLPQTPPLPVSDSSVDVKPVVADDSAIRKEKKKKFKKRSLDDVNSQDDAKLRKKKKKGREGFGQDFPPMFKMQAVKPSAEAEAESAAESSVAPPPPPRRLVVPLLPDVDLGPLDQIEMPTVLADLRALALDPFYGIEREVPLKVLHLLLRFRTQFYSKSLPAEGDAQAPGQEGQPGKAPTVAAAAATVAPPSLKKEPKEKQQQQQREQTMKKPSKLPKRLDDPSKAGRKRAPSDRQEEMLADDSSNAGWKRAPSDRQEEMLADDSSNAGRKRAPSDRQDEMLADDSSKAGRKRAPSDRQEEMSAKRNKKVNQVKSLASEKKASLTQKTSSDGPKGNNGTTAAATAAGPSTTDPARRLEKQELVPTMPPPPVPSGNPAFLIMKFPPKSTLPSVSNLKARFARFGSLEVDSIRVFWKSHSCRVQFKHHSDAVRAMQHVESNDIFGPKVDYSVKEVEAPAPEPQPEPPRQHSEPQGDGSLQFRSGNGAGSSSGVQSRGGQQQQQQQPQGRLKSLKSILKKPGDDAGKENQRVKFLLSRNGNGNGNGGSSSKRSSPPPSASRAVGFADVSPPRPLPSKSASFQDLPPPPPQPRQNPLQSDPLPPPARSYESYRPSLPPPPARSYYEPRQLPPPPPLRPIENRAPVPPAQFSEPSPQRLPMQQPQQHRGQREAGRSRNNDVDISHQMLSLLLRCSDIVSILRSFPDFVPYRPL